VLPCLSPGEKTEQSQRYLARYITIITYLAKLGKGNFTSFVLHNFLDT